MNPLNPLYGTSTATVVGTAKDIFSLDDIKKAKAQLKALQDKYPKKWFLINPEGAIVSGEPEELLKILIPFHPLLKIPVYPMEYKP